MRQLFLLAGVPSFLIYYFWGFGILLSLYVAIIALHLVWRNLVNNGARKTLYVQVTEDEVAVKGAKPKSQNVCVVGVGVGGLACAKELVDEGHKVTCYERNASYGGVFYYANGKGGVYDNTILTISNYFMAFSDFPPTYGEDYHFWHHEKYYKYVEDYVAHFKLLEKAKFHFEVDVVAVEKQSNGKWKVTTQSVNGGAATSEIFDAVAVCSGAHQIPYIPDVPGVDFNLTATSDKGVLCCHSESYKNAVGDPRFEKKTVICVGAGETGVDVAYEIASVSKQAFLSVKRTPMVIPRAAWNVPVASDVHTSRSMLYMNHHYAHYLHTFDQWLKLITGNNALGQSLFKGSAGLGDPSAAKVADLALRSGGGVTDQFLTKNCNFIARMLDKKLLEKTVIKRVEGKTVHFTDGTKLDGIDTILFSTGYVTSFPFIPALPMLDQGVRSLYKHMFDPTLGESLAFIGFARPSSGGVPVACEIQARYFALMLSGTRKLPNNWVERIAVEADMENKQFHLTTLKTVVFYGEYMESLAHHVGCVPDLWSYLFTDPLLWMRLFYGPMLSCQYRLKGPHANPALTVKTLNSIPFCTPGFVTVGQSVASVLSWIGGAALSARAPSW